MKETILVHMIFGSHLYGTNTPESDKDYKGVFLPNIKDLVLCRVPKSYESKTKTSNAQKNSSSDIDSSFYSLNYFIDLACKGETVALDMLHAPKRAFIEYHWSWLELQKIRSKFYTKNLSSLVGYARHQAAKYGVKGSRLHDARLILAILTANKSRKVGEMWDSFPTTDNLVKVYNEDGSPKFYDVCGKKMTLTASCNHYLEMVDNFVVNYGDRARKAELNEGIDWKAVSHAFRAAYQVRAILSEGDFTYPLKETPIIQDVKAGRLNYAKVVGPLLDSLLDQVMELSNNSTLPEKVDREFIDNWILDMYYQKYL